MTIIPLSVIVVSMLGGGLYSLYWIFSGIGLFVCAPPSPVTAVDCTISFPQTLSFVLTLLLFILLPVAQFVMSLTDPCFWSILLDFQLASSVLNVSDTTFVTMIVLGSGVFGSCSGFRLIPRAMTVLEINVLCEFLECRSTLFICISSAWFATHVKTAQILFIFIM